MEEVIVRNEFDHSYLLFPMEEKDREEYSYQMISQNHIPGLLSCRLRFIEEVSYYSYEISSKRSLMQEYSDRKMRYGDLKEFFYGINVILKKATEFLLEKEGFLLEPEYIFTDLENEGLECVYLPVISLFEGNNSRYRKLADFLLDRTDHRDEHAVNAVYQFYKMSKEEFFSFEAFIGFMEKEDLILQAEERRRTDGRILLQDSEQESIKEEHEVIDKQEDIPRQEQTVGRWKAPCILFILGILLLAIYLFMPAAKKYAFYFLVPGFAFLAVSVFLSVLALYHWLCKNRTEDLMELEAPVTVEEYFDDILNSETVFFDEDLTLCLKWKEGHFLKEYALTSFPVAVGKLKESVGLCIEDASISRLHARFTQQEDVVILQDLDSTNGTWVNGKKLAAGEEVVIRRNDEIQFGKIIVNVV